MIKVINCIGGLNYGGIESVLRNYAQFINREEFVYDFLTCDNSQSDIKTEIAEAGSNIYYYTRRRENLIRSIIDIYLFLRRNKNYYDIMHVHLNYEGFVFLFFGKICGYRIRICHSHTTFNGEVGTIIKIKRFLTCKFANYYAGCSRPANDFLYGGSRRSFIIPNAIDYEKFYYNINDRKINRKKLGIKENEKAFALIGRINHEKNHQFICNIINKIELSNIKVFFVGDGERRKILENYVIKCGLSEKIIFLGTRKDIATLLNAFDGLILPSTHEGFPMVMVEAQVNGLKCIVSNNVPRDTDISGRVEYIDLDEKKWMEALLNADVSDDKTRMEALAECKNNNNVRKTIKVLEDYYKSLI